MFILHRIEVEEEIRAQVDELMRQELKNLKIVNILESNLTRSTLCHKYNCYMIQR